MVSSKSLHAPSRQFLTTGDVAKYCGVNFRTVIRWIKAGRLKAFQLPGRGDNRVSKEDFLEFLQINHLAIPPELEAPSKQRALIVENDPALVELLGRIFATAGFETKSCATGFEAGSLLTSYKPDLITLDLNLQGIDGQKTLQFIRSQKEFERIKIIVISGMDRPNLDRALAAGANAVVEKPFSNASLLREVHRLLNAK